MKSTWKIIKETMNIFQKNSKKTTIKWGNHISVNETDIAATFNRYFSSIGINLAQNIQSSHMQFNDYLDTPNPNSLFFVPTHSEEVF